MDQNNVVRHCHLCGKTLHVSELLCSCVRPPPLTRQNADQTQSKVRTSFNLQNPELSVT